MPRRTFRYNRELDKFIEVINSADLPASAYVQDDITPFVSVVDGVLISSRSQLRDYMGQRNLVHYDSTMQREEDRYEQGRQRRASREQMWEHIDRLLSTGRSPSQR